MHDMAVHNAGRQKDGPKGASGGWLHNIGKVLIQSTKDLFIDSASQWAAAIAYYSLLSSFPLLLAVATIAAYFIDPQVAIDKSTQLLGEVVPKGENRVGAIVQEALDARGTVSLLSIGALLWSGSRVFGAVTLALNIVYDADETYGFFKRTFVEVIMLMSIGSVFILALASRWLVDLAWNVLEILPTGQGIIIQVIDMVLPVLLLLTSFFLIYRFVPRRQQDSRSAFSGAVVSTTLFLVARPLFLWFLDLFGSYSLIYGSIATMVLLVFWAWVVSMILLFGGEIASHVQKILIEGESAEEVEHQHQARSPRRKHWPDTADRRKISPERSHQTNSISPYLQSSDQGLHDKRPRIGGALALVVLLVGAAWIRRLVGR
jgi:membrane protein